MAGSIIISQQNVWTVGIHAFLPITEMLRLAYATKNSCNDEIESIFTPLDEGFDYISLADLSESLFTQFICQCEKLKLKNLGDVLAKDQRKAVFDSCLSDLLSQLKMDPRYNSSKSV